MSKRGKVLRDPHAGPGLLMVEGQQYQFLLEGVWKSDVPPTPGLVVDLEFDSQGKIESRTLPGNPDDLVAKYSVEFIEFTFAVGTCGQRDRPVRVQMVDMGKRQKGM